MQRHSGLTRTLLWLGMTGSAILFSACGQIPFGGELLQMGHPMGTTNPKDDQIINPNDEGQFRPASLPPVVDDPSIVIRGHLSLTLKGTAHVTGQAVNISGQSISQGTVYYIHTGLNETGKKILKKEVGIAIIDANGEFQFDTTEPFLPGDTIYLAAISEVVEEPAEVTSSESEIVSLTEVEVVETPPETPPSTTETTEVSPTPDQPEVPTETPEVAPTPNQPETPTTSEITPPETMPPATTPPETQPIVPDNTTLSEPPSDPPLARTRVATPPSDAAPVEYRIMYNTITNSETINPANYRTRERVAP